MKYENGINQDVIFSTERKALKTATEEFALGRFAAKKTVAKYSGNQLKCHYFEHLPDDAVKDLTEGVTPDSANLVRVSKTGVLKRQGLVIPFTDEFQEQFENSPEFHFEAGQEIGYSIGTKLDKDAFSTLLNDAGNTVDVTAVGGWDEAFKSARKLFRKANVPQLTSIKTGSTKVGTSPVNAGWYMFVDVDDADAVREATDFLSVEDYGYTDGVVKNEIGVIKSLGIRIVESLNIGSGMALMIGDEAFADLGLSGKNRIEYITKPLGSGVTVDSSGATDVIRNDALDQMGSTGGKTRNSCMTLFPERILKFTNL